MSAHTSWARERAMAALQQAIDTGELESPYYSPRRQSQSPPQPKPSGAAAAAAARSKRQGPVWLPPSPPRPQPPWQPLPPRTQPRSPPSPSPLPPPALPWRMPSKGWVTSSATPSPEARTGHRPRSPLSKSPSTPPSKSPSTPVERRAKLLAVQQQWQVASPLWLPSSGSSAGGV